MNMPEKYLGMMAEEYLTEQGIGKRDNISPKKESDYFTVWTLSDYVNLPHVPFLGIRAKLSSKRWMLKQGEFEVKACPDDILLLMKKCVDFLYATVRAYDPNVKDDFIEAKRSLIEIEKRRRENHTASNCRPKRRT